MGGTVDSSGLRPIRDGEAAMFAAWELAERPYPWNESVFPIGTLVAEDQQGVYGYVAVQIVVDEAYVANLMVDPKRRRCGLGGLLLQKVMMWAWSRGARRMTLDVDVSNIPAIRLYEKSGFEIIQRRSSSYPRGEDALVMGKKL